MDQQLARAGAAGASGRDADRMRAGRVDRQRDALEPGRGAVHARARAGQQIGNEALAGTDIGERITFGRIEHAGAEAQLARWW